MQVIEDMYIYLAPGEICEHAVMASVDVPTEAVHCTMVLEAEGTVMAPQVNTEDHTKGHEWLEDDNDDEGVPELHSEVESSDSDSDSDSSEDGHDDMQDLQQHQANTKASWEAYQQTS